MIAGTGSMRLSLGLAIACGICVMAWGEHPLCAADTVETKAAGRAGEANSLASQLKEITERSGTRGKAAFLKDTLLLGTHDVAVTDVVRQPLLFREIPRQALLIAAREGLGLSTRDATLRETFLPAPAGAHGAVEIASVVRNQHLELVLFRRDGDDFDILLDQKIPLEEESIEALTTVCTRLANAEMVDVLKRAGYSGTPTRADGPDEIPEDVVQASGVLNFLTQFHVARELHRAMRESGASQARVDLLARTYANLGSLTDYLYAPAYKVFSARALLMAERAVVHSGGSAEALWTRAYVRALVGRHHSALADIAAAREAAPQQAMNEPKWGAIIDACCRFDKPALEELAEPPAQRPLARYLQLRAAEHTTAPLLLVEQARVTAEANPECLRVVATLVGIPSLGTQRSAPQLAFQVFETALPQGLLTLSGLSDELRGDIEVLEDAFGVPGYIQRRKVISQFRRESLAGRDRREPSLSALAHLIEETGVVQVAWQLNAYKYWFGVPVENLVEPLQPLYMDHPYRQILQSYGWESTRFPRALKDLEAVLAGPDSLPTQVMLANHLYRSSASLYNRWRAYADRHGDIVAGDLLQAIKVTNATHYKISLAREFQKCSPHSPLLVDAIIRGDWKTAEPKAAEWEKRYADDPSIVQALGQAYFRADRLEDAERLMKQRIALSPDIVAYRELAALYEHQKKFDVWRETLLQALEQPALGLEHAEIHVTLADHWMKAGDYRKAQPHADRAAASYAHWGMLSAVRCYEGLQEWDQAELWMRRIAERYTEASPDWYFWCIRTGQGDAQAARDHARQYFESLTPPVHHNILAQIGIYYLVSKEDDKALQVYRASFEAHTNPYTGLHAAIIADRLKETETRDLLLKQILEKPGPRYVEGSRRTELKEAARTLLAFFQAEQKEFDQRTLDHLRSTAAAGEPTNLEYFFGMALLNHGLEAEGRKLLQSAASSPEDQLTRSLARVTLRELKIDIPPEREREVNPAEIAAGLPDREVAEWVIGIGARVTISAGPRGLGRQSIRKIEELPQEHFQVMGIDARGNKKFDDAGCERIAQLRGLRDLYCPGTAVTGRGLRHLKGRAALIQLDVSELELTDDDLETLASLPSLQMLRFSVFPGKGKISDGGLRALGGMQNLSSLVLAGHDIGDEGLAHLAELTQLQSLQIGSRRQRLERLTNDGLKHLSGMTRLRMLHLDGTAINDDGLKYLAELPQLSMVSLASTQVSGTGAAPLAKLPNLSMLILAECPVDDAGVAVLSRLPKLGTLSLHKAKISDAAIDSLSKVPSLRFLDLNDTTVSPEALERLRTANPNCRVSKR